MLESQLSEPPRARVRAGPSGPNGHLYFSSKDSVRDGVADEGRRRLVVFYLLAFGMDLVCFTLGGPSFRVGFFKASGGPPVSTGHSGLVSPKWVGVERLWRGPMFL
jgi:hypothetical protein